MFLIEDNLGRVEDYLRSKSAGSQEFSDCFFISAPEQTLGLDVIKRIMKVKGVILYSALIEKPNED